MGFTLDQVNAMTAEERQQAMECLWNAMIVAGQESAPLWYRDLLRERRHRLETGEDERLRVGV